MHYNSAKIKTMKLMRNIIMHHIESIIIVFKKQPHIILSVILVHINFFLYQILIFSKYYITDIHIELITIISILIFTNLILSEPF